MLKRIVMEIQIFDCLKTVELVEDDTGIGKKIAKKLGVFLNGWWEDLKEFVFTDPVTESSFTARNEYEARKKLDALRVRFANA
ncbi:MAG: hypothetical protein HQK96_20645 [Nitrospirae bacterium]|nr:hypothetical protein [Nitrospirota bacterium]